MQLSKRFHPQENRELVAVKEIIVPFSVSSQIVEEFTVLQKISHPCIVKYKVSLIKYKHHVWYSNTVYIALELLNGGQIYNTIKKTWASGE